MGCGSDVSLADAREECNSAEIIATGEALTDSAFNTAVSASEAIRDNGVTRSEFIAELFTVCDEGQVTIAARDQCIICWTSIAAAVWP